MKQINEENKLKDIKDCNPDINDVDENYGEEGQGFDEDICE